MTEGFSRIDQELCTGCGSCVSTCPAEAITGERHKPHVVSEERCVGCGRCVQVCSAYDTVFEERTMSRAKRLEERGLPAGLTEPLFAAYDHCRISEVRGALAGSKRCVMALCGPAVCGAIAEDFGLPAGSVPPGRVVAALKKIGFKKVFDFSLPAAVAVVEEAEELVHRLETGGTLPLINSSCPAAVKFIEQFHPELIHHLAGCKSPAMIAGTLLKSHVAAIMKLNASQVYSVSIGPCTSRKFEAGRTELSAEGFPHVDAVLTTRELACIIKDSGISLPHIAEEPFDPELPPVPEMGNAYCNPSDVSEAVLRVGYSLLQKSLEGAFEVKFEAGSEGVRTASVQLDKHSIKAAAITGLTAANPFFEAIKAGKNEFAFIELLACPMGCVSGGGQPKVLLPQDKEAAYSARAKVSSCDAKKLPGILQNVALQKLYSWFAKSPGDKSNRALHTQYEERKIKA